MEGGGDHDRDMLRKKKSIFNKRKRGKLGAAKCTGDWSTVVVRCGRWTPAAHWPVSLAESISTKFPSKDLCLQMEKARHF